MSRIASIRFKIEGWPITLYDFNANRDELKYSYNDEKANNNNEIYNITSDFYDKIEETTKNWSGMYEPQGYEVCDGVSWELNLTYNDGKKRIVSGRNAYPNNYDELIDYLNKIIGR